MATNKTRIKIRHGSTTPATGTDGLLPYELGWDGSHSVLYINNNGGIRQINSENAYGIPLVSGDNVDTLPPGIYYSGSSTVSETLNGTKPNGNNSGFRLEVIRGYNYNFGIQIAYDSTPSIKIRKNPVYHSEAQSYSDFTGIPWRSIITSTDVASKTSIGIVTTGAQNFLGRKGFGYINSYGYNDSGTAVRWVDQVYLCNAAGTMVAQRWYDCGDATNITTGRFTWREYSPNSPADTSITGKYEDYLLPAVNTGRTGNVTYEILTSKNAVTIAQGGTSATTAGAAANNLLLGLPTWTANPTDDTYFIRRDTGGGDAFGQVKASTIYNYVKGKTDTLYVKKAGDTVTGNLTISKTSSPQLILKNTTMDTKAASISAAQYNSLYFEDKNDYINAFVQGVQATDGHTEVHLAARRRNTANDNNVQNLLKLSIAADGTQTVSVSSAAAWRSGIGAVNKAGDTMSGNLIVSKTGDTYVEAKNTTTGCRIEIDVNDAGKHGLWSSGYYTNSTYTASSKWIYYRGTDGEAHSDVKIYGAVWNDYAEYRNTLEDSKPGQCVIENGDDSLRLSTSRMQRAAHIVSDTFGFAIGKTDKCKTPVAVSGRVLAYIYEGRQAARGAIGRPVCSGPNGTVSIMTDEEYKNFGYCAIGTISAVPEYEKWGEKDEEVDVNGRIWIKVY